MRLTGLPIDVVADWPIQEQFVWLRAAALAESQRREMIPDETALIFKEIAPWLKLR
jgi:hypothetical protein